MVTNSESDEGSLPGVKENSKRDDMAKMKENNETGASGAGSESGSGNASAWLLPRRVSEKHLEE